MAINQFKQNNPIESLYKAILDLKCQFPGQIQYEEICGRGSWNDLKYLWLCIMLLLTERSEWFQCFKDGNFHGEGRHSGGKEVSKDAGVIYLMKTRASVKKSWDDNWEWLTM